MKVKLICFLKILDSHQVETETVIHLEEANPVITLSNASRFYLQQHFSTSGWLTLQGILCGGSCPIRCRVFSHRPTRMPTAIFPPTTLDNQKYLQTWSSLGKNHTPSSSLQAQT